jgi:hypothetical protein
MKIKYLYQIIFILLVASGSFLLATYVESAKVTDFILNERSRIEEDDQRLLLATAIANRNDGSDAFIIKQPLLSVEIIESNIQAEIDFYSLSLFNDNDQTNVWALYLNQLTIEDSIAMLDQDDYHVVQVSLIFNQTINLGNTPTNTSLETFTTLYSNRQKLILIELDSLLEQYPQLQLQGIIFSYVLEDGSSNNFYTLSPIELDVVQWESENLYARYQNQFQTSSDIVYDATLLQSLTHLNYYYLTHFSVYLVLVGTVTYMVFFRKRKYKPA